LREYLLDLPGAEENLPYYKTLYCLVGHSHAPAVFSFGRIGDGAVYQPADGEEFALAGDRMIINPGSVGQPRDGDPRASYGIIDMDRRVFTLHRMPYDIPSVQARMREWRLPERLAERLEHGR
jgi:diadenosine tetraphosphatase ApaH/serine/threonine PP2A family protein phosphatase